MLAALLGKTNKGFGVLMVATIGVPFYACGGKTIPFLQMWLADGMSMGSTVAFTIIDYRVCYEDYQSRCIKNCVWKVCTVLRLYHALLSYHLLLQ